MRFGIFSKELNNSKYTVVDTVYTLVYTVCASEGVFKVKEQSSRSGNESFSDLLSFPSLSHHRTCRSAYGGFALSLSSVIGFAYRLSSLPLYCRDTPYLLERRAPIRTSDYQSRFLHDSTSQTMRDSDLRLDRLAVGYFGLC